MALTWDFSHVSFYILFYFFISSHLKVELLLNYFFSYTLIKSVNLSVFLQFSIWLYILFSIGKSLFFYLPRGLIFLSITLVRKKLEKQLKYIFTDSSMIIPHFCKLFNSLNSEFCLFILSLHQANTVKLYSSYYRATQVSTTIMVLRWPFSVSTLDINPATSNFFICRSLTGTHGRFYLGWKV